MFYVIEGVSHTDHRVSEAHINWLRCDLEGKLQPGVNVITKTLPAHLPRLHSALVYHPSEDDLTYERRGSRAYESCMVKRHELPTREITAIIGPHNGDTPVLYTAFGGPAAPRKPNDPHFDGEGGRCTKCHGAGFDTVDPYLMGDEVRVVCEPCSGTGRSHELRESIKFWANHALATEGPQEWAKEPAQIGTPSAVIPLAIRPRLTRRSTRPPPPEPDGESTERPGGLRAPFLPTHHEDTMNQISAMFAAAAVTEDADVSGIASALADISTSSRLMAEWAELHASEIVAEESGDEAAVMRAMDASDAWCERTEPEFRNRLDAIIPFKALSEETIGRLVDKFVMELEAQLADRRVTIDLTEAARKWLGKKGYDPQMGARPLGRVIQENLKKPLAEEILFGSLTKGGTVKVDVVDGQLAFTFTSGADDRAEHVEDTDTASEDSSERVE